MKKTTWKSLLNKKDNLTKEDLEKLWKFAVEEENQWSEFKLMLEDLLKK